MTKIGKIGEKIVHLGIPTYALGLRRGIPTLGGFIRLLRMVSKEAPAILQTWMYHADLLGTLVWMVRPKAKLVWNIRCSYMDFSRYRPLTRWVVRCCARLSHKPELLIVNSLAGQVSHTRLGYSPKSWIWLPNGFDIQTFQPDPEGGRWWRAKLGVGENDFLIGMVARFDPMKDIPTFLQAAVRVREKIKNIFFLLLGAGLEEANPFFRDHPLRRELGSRLHLLGYQEDVRGILSALDLMTVTSLGEGFPNAVGEAMACGIPCLVTDVGDAAFLVGNRDWVVPPRSPQVLAQAWERFWELPKQKRAAMGQEARERIINYFDLEDSVKRWEEIYWRLAGEEENGDAGGKGDLQEGSEEMK